MHEGWLMNLSDQWTYRFHRDEKSWVRDQKVFVGMGRPMPDGSPLLKERRSLRKDAAEQLWKSLPTEEWKPLKTHVWGSSADV